MLYKRKKERKTDRREKEMRKKKKLETGSWRRNLLFVHRCLTDCAGCVRVADEEDEAGALSVPEEPTVSWTGSLIIVQKIF